MLRQTLHLRFLRRPSAGPSGRVAALRSRTAFRASPSPQSAHVPRFLPCAVRRCSLAATMPIASDVARRERYTNRLSSAFVAQGIEHRSPKAGVGRSNRPGGTSKIAGQMGLPIRPVCVSGLYNLSGWTRMRRLLCRAPASRRPGTRRVLGRDGHGLKRCRMKALPKCSTQNRSMGVVGCTPDRRSYQQSSASSVMMPLASMSAAHTAVTP